MPTSATYTINQTLIACSVGHFARASEIIPTKGSCDEAPDSTPQKSTHQPSEHHLFLLKDPSFVTHQLNVINAGFSTIGKSK
jgi:hypothetical protein